MGQFEPEINSLGSLSQVFYLWLLAAVIARADCHDKYHVFGK
jgi:hypothetical protein